jgi:hypothetical protein
MTRKKYLRLISFQKMNLKKPPVVAGSVAAAEKVETKDKLDFGSVIANFKINFYSNGLHL